MIFEINFQTVEFIEKTSTAKYIIATSKAPVASLAAINVQISKSNVFPSKDLLSNTHILLVINAKATATIHAIIVDRTFGIWIML